MVNADGHGRLSELALMRIYLGGKDSRAVWQPKTASARWIVIVALWCASQYRTFPMESLHMFHFNFRIPFAPDWS